MKFSSNVFLLFMMFGATVISPGELYAYIACDTHQIGDKPPEPNAISIDLVIPFGFFCHHLEVNRNNTISIQKAAYSSNGTVGEPLVGGICNWRIDFVYYEKGKEYMRDKGETAKGCAQGASRAIAKSKTLVQSSSSCAELFVDGKVRLIQCHTIID